MNSNECARHQARDCRPRFRLWRSSCWRRSSSLARSPRWRAEINDNKKGYKNESHYRTDGQTRRIRRRLRRFLRPKPKRSQNARGFYRDPKRTDDEAPPLGHPELRNFLDFVDRIGDRIDARRKSTIT